MVLGVSLSFVLYVSHCKNNCENTMATLCFQGDCIFSINLRGWFPRPWSTDTDSVVCLKSHNGFQLFAANFWTKCWVFSHEIVFFQFSEGIGGAYLRVFLKRSLEFRARPKSVQLSWRVLVLWSRCLQYRQVRCQNWNDRPSSKCRSTFGALEIQVWSHCTRVSWR